MKIEKISDNQIRCTLTGEDLKMRHIKLSELAYGSDSARELFRDMMQQARTKLGFQADNIPLMIEAVPLGPESIMLVITKVEDPEELDTRFAKFSPFNGNGGEERTIEDADDILNLVRHLYDAKQKAATPAKEEAEPEVIPAPVRGSGQLDYVRLYRFPTLDRAIEAAGGIGGSYQGESTLYRTGEELPYSLIVHKSSHTPEEYNCFCNILSEYGESASCSPAREAHLKEHGELIMEGNALQQLHFIHV